MLNPPAILRPFLIAIMVSLAASSTLGQSPSPIANPKYVFLFLSDSAGMAHLEIARQYSRQIHNQELVIVDKIANQGTIGILTTHAADSLSTDSAAAATAMANGCKAKIGGLGICADGTDPDGGSAGEEGVGLSTIGGSCRSREQADTPVERLPGSAIFAFLEGHSWRKYRPRRELRKRSVEAWQDERTPSRENRRLDE